MSLQLSNSLLDMESQTYKYPWPDTILGPDGRPVTDQPSLDNNVPVLPKLKLNSQTYKYPWPDAILSPDGRPITDQPTLAANVTESNAATIAGGRNGEQDARFPELGGRRFRLVFLSLVVSVFLSALDIVRITSRLCFISSLLSIPLDSGIGGTPDDNRLFARHTIRMGWISISSFFHSIHASLRRSRFNIWEKIRFDHGIAFLHCRKCYVWGSA
jgi:hypothetical protein